MSVCIVCYVMYMNVPGEKFVLNAEGIRKFLRTRYFEPARRKQETLVTLRAGDIHRELGLRNRVPSVCQVMESRILEREAGVRVSSKQGPPSGRGTTLTITYTVDLSVPAREPAGSPVRGGGRRAGKMESAPRRPVGVDIFLALRGTGKQLFASEGGGEAWLKKERSLFYPAAKKDLK